MPDLVTTDIDNFWRAFDAADRLPTRDRVQIFQTAYYDVASIGMKDFIRLRLGDVEGFEQVVTEHDAYYRSARSSMMRIREFEGEIRHFYKRFEKLYPALRIPRATFVVGRLACGGTKSDSGLLIGAEMFGRTDKMAEDSLNHWHRAVIWPVAEIPTIVIHELVHIQQCRLGTSDQSLLANSVREGMAVYVTEWVTRRDDRTAPYLYGRQHEKELWGEFSQVMHNRDCSQWLGNGVNSVDRPADLGYYIGRQICAAYVKQHGKSRDTLARLLETEDYEEIYKESAYAGGD